MHVQAKRMILHILVFLADVELCHKGNIGMTEDCEEDILEENLFEKHFNFTHILLCCMHALVIQYCVVLS